MSDITPSKLDKKPKFMQLNEDRVNEKNFSMGMKMGGYSVGAHNMRQGKVQFQSGQEVIKIGEVNDILDGKGIYIGRHIENNGDTDYEFRFGDPSGSFIHWDGSTLTIKGEGSGITNIDGGNIQTNTITAIQIDADTITANEMNVGQLSAISADIGDITAGTVTGVLIRTSTSGARVVMDDSSNSLNIYDSGGSVDVSLRGSGLEFWDGGTNQVVLAAQGNDTLTIDLQNLGSGYTINSNAILPGTTSQTLGNNPLGWNALYLTSPDGTAWEVTVDDSGNLQTA